MMFLGPCSRSVRRLRHRSFQRCLSCTSNRRADEVRIVEVGPRDGLQNEKKSISLKTKIELIERLAKSGVRDIEGGSFVSPKWVPQMASSGEILKHLVEHPPNSPSRWPISYNFLVPNLKGLEDFLRARNGPTPSEAKADAASFRDTQSSDRTTQGIGSVHGQVQPSSHAMPGAFTEISVFTAATESFAQANMNCTISESLERFKPIIALAKARNIRVRGYVSVALGCPYEGISVSPSKVAEITTSLLEMGVDEVSIADTTGMGQKPRVLELFKMLSSFGIASKDLALHFHDTYGQALVNILLGLEYGIRTFDSSVGGLGGCPYAKGATGNVATEDLVYMLHSLGAKTGVDLEEMAKVGAWISDELGRPNDSRTGKAISSKLLAPRVRDDSLG